MSRYTTQFKLSVVQQYLAGEESIQTIASQHGIKQAKFRCWVRSFQHHGESGLTPKYSHYDATFKLSVLRHMWDNHLSQLETAAYFDIRNPSILAQWAKKYSEGGFAALEPRPKGRKPPMLPPETLLPAAPEPEDARSREELITENNQLRLEVAYIKKSIALAQARASAVPQKKRK
jgi:transposase